MSELAFNINGEAFEVPANATGWRVRKMRAKGSPEVVYAREGQPLVLPIDADMEALRAEVDTNGRYRLDLVDQNNKAIPTAPSGYVQINLDTAVLSESTAGTSSAALLPPSDNIAIEALRTQAMIAQSVVERFPQMMEAAAMLLRAADGAGLPARPPMAVADDDEDGDASDEASAKQPGFDVNALLAQLAPLLVAGITSGKIKVPGLASLFDWRKAKPTSEPRVAAPAIAESSAKAAVKPAPAVELPPLDPATMQHFIAIQSALAPDEAVLARAVAAELAPAQLREWFDELKKLTVPDAVAKIRTLIAGNGKKDGAS